MSTTIDQKVVEMRFDNKQFEKNVAATMSTLDRFKEKLKFKGATTGLENIGAAAKKVNMDGLGTAVETVRTKFSALEVMGVTALANITNSAVNAGKRMVSALTIDPVKTGLSEYETKMNSIQVLKANTRDKNTMEDITKALDDLNTYADNTIYNFAQMTSNMGKFAAQGFDVFESANAVKGLANLAAASGASAEDMARATYQMTQAMGSSIKLMDWNSLRNANMATQDLKNTLIALAKVHGVAIDDMIKKEGTFEYTLQSGWLTGEMFTEAMNIYSGVYSDLELKEKGFTETQIADFKKLSAMAESAATEVKTWTQLWDVLKETAQSGWTQTWEILFGDFESAKKTFTDLQKYFGGIINAFSEARNTLLGGAFNLSKPWEAITAKLKGSGLGKVVEVAEKIGDATDKIKEFQETVSKVWKGDFGNSDTGRFEKLDALGYDHRVIQDLVNKGSDYKITIEDIEASHKKFGLTMDKTTDSTKKAADAFQSVSDEKLRDAGLTESEIRLYRALEKEAKRTGETIDEVVKRMSERDGRTLLIESFKNAWSGFVSVLKSIKTAWQDTFDPITSVDIYRVIDALNKMSEKFANFLGNKDTVDKMTRTFKGLFAALDIVTTLIAGPLKIAFKIFTQLLGAFGFDVLDVTAGIGDAIVRFRDWMDSVLDFSGAFERVAPTLKYFYESIRNWIKGMKDAEDLPTYIADGIMNGLTVAFGVIKSLLGKLRSSISDGLNGAGNDVISGFVLEIWEGIKIVGEVMWKLGEKILEKFRDVLGIESPSKETREDGKNTIQGFIDGVKEVGSKAWDALKNFGNKCLEIIRNIDFGKVFSMIVTGGMTIAVLKIAKAVENFSEPFGNFGDLIDQIKDTVKGLGNAIKFNLKMEAFKSLAIAIAILVASLIALTFCDPKELLISVGIIAALALVMGGLVAVMGKFNEAKPIELAKIGLTLLALASSMLIMAFAAKLLSSMGLDDEHAWDPFIGLGVLAGIMVGVIAAFGAFVKGKAAQNVDKVGKMMIKMSFALLLMVGVAKLVSMMKEDDLKQGILGIAAFGVIIAGLLVVSKLAGKKVDKIGGTILKISIALLMLVAVSQIIAKINPEEFDRGFKGIVLFGMLIAGLIAATRLAGGGKADKIGGTILAISAAMLLLIGAAKIIATMNQGELKRAGQGLTALGIIIVGLIAATRLAGGNDLKGVGPTLLMMAVAIGILAGIAVVLSLVNPEDLARGVIAVGFLAAMMSVMVVATKYAQSCVGTLVVLTVAIAILAGAVAALSFIDPTSLAGATLAIGIILGMFALVLSAAGTIKGSMGIMIVLTVAIAVLAGAVYLLATMTDTDKAIKVAVSLSVLLLSMAAAIAVLGLIGPMALSGIGALAALVGLIVGFGALMVGIGYLMTEFPQLESFVDKGIPMLEKLAHGLGSVVGNLIAGFAEGVMSGLPAIGDCLSDFMENAQGFIDGARGIDASVLTGIKALAETILILTAVDVINGLTSWFTGGSSLTDFGKQLPQLGSDLASFASNIGTFSEEQVATVTCAANAIKALAQAAEAIPNEGGWMAKIFGDNNISNFASNFAPLGTSLKDFATNVGSFGEEQVTTIDYAAQAISKMAQAAQDIPNDGGWFGKLFGDNSIETFGGYLPGLGTNLSGFVTNLGTFTEDQVTTVSCAANALKAMAQAAKGLPNEGGWFAKLFGDNSIETFGGYLPGLGTNLKGFVANLGTFTEDQVATVRSAVNAINAFAALGEADISTLSSKLDNFGGKLTGFAEDLKSFCSKLPGTETITTAVANVKNVINSLSAITKGEVDTIASFGDSLKKLGKSAVSDFTDEFTNKSVGADLKAAGEDMIGSVIDGMESKEDDIETAASGLASTAVGELKSESIYDKYVSAGSYVVSGFVAGIDANTFKAEAAAAAMASAALEAAEEALDENSPSKEMYRVGKFGGMGFVNALLDYSKAAYSAGSTMASSAKSGLGDVISKVVDLINSDIDTQPTIAPVLDLSNVRAGANALSNMLNFSSSVGVVSNVGAISRIMNRQNQNGSNDDVVSAIKDLGKGIDNLPRESYSIGNVNVNGDAEVEEAIRVLVRAVTMERRV